jgi:hypothetical protein
MVAVHLGDRPILVAACGIAPALRDAVRLLKSLLHISPIVLPPAAIVRDQIPAALTASQIWQVFQNGDDCVLSTDETRQALDDLESAVGSLGKDLSWAGDRIDRWQAQVVKHALAGAGRRANLVFANESAARAALAELGLTYLEKLGAADGEIYQSRGTGIKIVIAPGAGGDAQFLVRAVERLRDLDPAAARLRPY